MSERCHCNNKRPGQNGTVKEGRTGGYWLFSVTGVTHNDHLTGFHPRNKKPALRDMWTLASLQHLHGPCSCENSSTAVEDKASACCLEDSETVLLSIAVRAKESHRTGRARLPSSVLLLHAADQIQASFTNTTEGEIRHLYICPTPFFWNCSALLWNTPLL